MMDNSRKPSYEPALNESVGNRSSFTQSFAQWLNTVLGHAPVQAKMRVRGNNLHVLCEGVYCPDADAIAQQVQHALTATAIAQFLPANGPEIHRIILYGRAQGQIEPGWARAINLNGDRSTIELAQRNRLGTATVPTTQPELEAARIESTGARFSADNSVERPSTVDLARQGQPEAIAHYLSNALSALGIAVHARVKSSGDATLKRLLVVCESAYTPDPALLADPVAQQLRRLELDQFRDAIVFGQVRGEARPEWLVRVDLTPPDDMLKEWSRWGDVQAIARLLNRHLVSDQIHLSALLKDSTLHLSCASSTQTPPDKLTSIAIVAPVLQSCQPQGIHSVTIYGVSSPATATLPDATPAWVYWLDLTSNRADTTPTLELARAGDLPALTFLLTRLINPDLDATLATGGVRVQIRQKGDLLHIMTDAPSCPRQDAIAPAIVRFLKPLQIASVSGVRIYGRRSGQKQPLWNFGVDFVVRNRLVPEASLEFAASDVHVDELLSPPGTIVLWSDLPEAEPGWSLKRLYGRTLETVQRSLIQTQLFIPSEAPALTSLTPANPIPEAGQRLKIALLWGFVGTLLVLQTDWLLGYWIRLSEQPTLRSQAPTQPPPPPQSTANFPDLSLQKNKTQNKDFDSSAFTRSGTTVLVPTEPGQFPAVLPASPLQAKAGTLINQSAAPSFNSRQLDGQLELYRRYLELNGAPDVLIIGSSRALRGVDPTALKVALAAQGYPGVKVFNFGINGATAQVVDLIMRQMLPQDKLPKLIIFADGARAFNSGRIDITYNGIVASEGYRSLLAGEPPIPSTIAAQVPNGQPRTQGGKTTSVTEESPTASTNGYQKLNEILNQHVAALSTIYADRDRLKIRLREQFAAFTPQISSSADVLATSDRLIDSSPSAAAATGGAIADNGQELLDIDGFLPLSVQFNPTTYYQKYARVSGDYDSDYEAFSLEGVQTEALITLTDYAKSHQVPIVFVNLPLTQQYLDPVRQRYETAFQQHMISLAPQAGFLYRDLGNALLTQPRYFSDPSHLNRFGAYDVSQRLAQDVMIPWQKVK